MTTYYALIFVAFIILCSNSSLAFRIFPYPNEQYQEGFPTQQMIMVLPNEGDITWPQYIAPPLYEMFDRKIFKINLFILFFSYYNCESK